MKYLVIIMLVYCLFTGIAYSWDDDTYEIQTRFVDFDSNDGFMDAGTTLNPYIIRNNNGREIGEIHSKFHDFDPNDGLMDAGSRLNPYVIDFNE